MSTYTQIAYHIVFGTKLRERTLDKQGREQLFGYITGILTNKKCHSYRIGGVEDHIHILTHLHQTVCLDQLVKDVKLATSDMIKRTGLFRRFSGWQEGYGAFTAAYQDTPRIINYIQNQEEHHRRKTFREEYLELLREHSVDFDEKYV
jgi:putative transposase